MLFDNPHLNGAATSADLTLQLHLSDSVQNEIITRLYDPVYGIHLNRMRLLPLGPGWQRQRGGPIVTDSAYPGPHASAMMDFAKRARQKSVDLQIGIEPTVFDSWVNDAPVADVVDYIMSGVSFAVSKGITPQWVGVQNEPTMTPPKMAPQRVHDIAVALRKRLDAAAPTVGISAPDDYNDITGEQHFRAIFADDEGRRSVKWLSIHGYDDTPPQRTAAYSQQYSVPFWMTEYDDRLYDKQTGWATKVIHEYLVTYNCSAVDILFGFLSSQGLGNPNSNYITLNATGNQYLGYTLNPSYYETGQYSKFIPRGAVRIDALSSNAAVKVSAFDVKGKKVIVMINPGATSPSVTIPSGTYRVVRTQMSGTDRLTNRGLFTGAVTLPPASVATLIEQ